MDRDPILSLPNGVSQPTGCGCVARVVQSDPPSASPPSSPPRDFLEGLPAWSLAALERPAREKGSESYLCVAAVGAHYAPLRTHYALAELRFHSVTALVAEGAHGPEAHPAEAADRMMAARAAGAWARVPPRYVQATMPSFAAM